MRRVRLLLCLLPVLLVVLYLLPRPDRQVWGCWLAPSPAVCDAVLVPLIGHDSHAEDPPVPAQRLAPDLADGWDDGGPLPAAPPPRDNEEIKDPPLPGRPSLDAVPLAHEPREHTEPRRPPPPPSEPGVSRPRFFWEWTSLRANILDGEGRAG